jgi:hypothetical protein
VPYRGGRSGSRCGPGLASAYAYPYGLPRRGTQPLHRRERQFIGFGAWLQEPAGTHVVNPARTERVNFGHEHGLRIRGNDVVYETFTKSVSNKQAVALFKTGLSQKAPPGTKVSYSFGAVDGVNSITAKETFKEGTAPITTEFMAAWHGAKACSVVLEKVVPTSNLEAALELAIKSFGM